MIPISLQYLLEKIQHPRSRADELKQLRILFAKREKTLSKEEQEAAQKMHALRQQLSESLQNIVSCSQCSLNQPLPAGRWDGGYCCSSATSKLFSENEVASLVASGITNRDLRPPKGDHAGCVFRGPKGCSLEAKARPNVCVRYVCVTLSRELFSQGSLETVEALGDELHRQFEIFVAARTKRKEEEFFSQCFDMIEEN